MNNLTSLFNEAVLITNGGGLYHGTVYSNNQYMDSTSTVTLIGSEKQVFKLKDVASIAVKKSNGQFYSVWYKDHVYRIDPTSDIYQEIASLF